MIGMACDPLQHTSMYERMNEGNFKGTISFIFY